MDKNAFFAEYKLCEADLIEANITWDELMRIEEEYCKLERSLREIENPLLMNICTTLKRPVSIPTATAPRVLCSFWRR